MRFWKAITKLAKIARLHIVLGGVFAFSIGALLGITDSGIADPLKIVLFYAIVFFGDLSTHYSNDYFDAKEDRLLVRKKVFSGKKILVNNPDLCNTAKSTSILFLIISNVLAIIAITFKIAPVELLVITLVANLLGWFYSAPPIRLVSRGLGEIIIALATGFIIPGVGYLAVAGQFSNLFMVFLLPFIFYGFILALSLEAPDIKTDSRTGKKNIGVRMGVSFVFKLTLASALAAFIYFVFYAWQIGNAYISLWMVSIFSLIPLAAGLAGFIGNKRNGDSSRFSAVNVFSLFVFNFLMILYLVIANVNL